MSNPAPDSRRTDPKSFLVRGLAMLAQLLIPLVIAIFTIATNLMADGLAQASQRGDDR